MCSHGHRGAVDADRAEIAIAGRPGRGIEVDRVEVDRPLDIGRHALEPGARRRLADPGHVEAAGADQGHLDLDVRGIGVGRGVDRGVVDDRRTPPTCAPPTPAPRSAPSAR
jgi:hypothetical protein